MRCGQVVPRAVPGPHQLPGNVGEIADRPVGVTGRVVLREGSVDVLPVPDVVGSDDARVADVDHVRVGEVQPDAEPDQEDEHQPEPRERDREVRQSGPGAAAGHHQHPDQQVHEHRVDERHRRGDLSPVEEDVRHPEAEEHDQVEVQQAKRAAPIGERNQEGDDQEHPYRRRVEPAAERARQAARHLPFDLRPRPHLDGAATALVDDHLGDLVRPREVAHLPAARSVGIGTHAHMAVASQLVLELVRESRDALHLLRSEEVLWRWLRRRGGTSEGRLGLDRLARSGRGGMRERGQRGRGERRDAKRLERAAAQPPWARRP